MYSCKVSSQSGKPNINSVKSSEVFVNVTASTHARVNKTCFPGGCANLRLEIIRELRARCMPSSSMKRIRKWPHCVYEVSSFAAGEPAMRGGCDNKDVGACQESSTRCVFICIRCGPFLFTADLLYSPRWKWSSASCRAPLFIAVRSIGRTSDEISGAFHMCIYRPSYCVLASRRTLLESASAVAHVCLETLEDNIRNSTFNQTLQPAATALLSVERPM